MVDAKLITNPRHNKINHILNRTWVCVKRWHGRQDNSTCFRDRSQIAQLDKSQRRLPRYQDQLPLLFQMHIRCTMDQILRNAMSDRRDCAHAAGADDHAAGEKRSAGDAGAEIAKVVVSGTRKIECIRARTQKSPKIKSIQADLLPDLPCEDFNRCGAHGEVHHASGREQSLQESHSVGRPARTGHRHHQISCCHEFSLQATRGAWSART